MELRHIRYFLAVVEERNFTRAAARVGIGQPPLSQQIRDLETEIGTLLFHRVPHGAELTDAGLAFLKQVQSMPGQVATAVLHAQRAARGETGTLRLGMTSSASLSRQVVSAITSFRDRWPEVEVTFIESDSSTLGKAVRSGDVDVAFLRHDATTEDRLRCYPLADEHMIAALPFDHPLLLGEQRDSICLLELRKSVFILPHRKSVPSIYNTVVSACAAAGFVPILGQSVPHFLSAVMLTAARFGITIVPASLRRVAVEGVTYLELDKPALTVKLMLVHAAHDPSATTRNFIRAANP